MVVEITIKIQDQYIGRVVDTFKMLAGNDINIDIREGSFTANWDYSFAPKSIDETNKQFANRAIKETIKALIRLSEYKKDYDRYNTDISNLDSPTQNVPDDIIE